MSSQARSACSPSHLITRAEAAELGLPAEAPPGDVESRLLADYEELKADLELLERFEPDAALEASVVLERAYIETPTTCDAFVTSEGAGERWETIV